MKIFALFLPQYYETKENNEWWGKGFTEWTNVKKAKPLFEGHIQPIHPVNDNYYCLLDKGTVRWQTDLMKEYKVDGLIYYHYYFCGRKMLEKPAENLLKWKDIDQNFFFCWANHDWNRAWEGNKKLLLKQTYGGEKDWECHFQYLLPFFKDDRYEKKDNKPLFMIFNYNFKEKNDMFVFFDKRCKQEGFNGIYLIESFEGGKKKSIQHFYDNVSEITEKIFYREPTVSREKYWLSYKNIRKRVWRIFYKRILKKSDVLWRLSGDELYKCQMKENNADNVIHGIHFGFDNSPRHGKRGVVIEPPSEKMFDRLMSGYKDSEYLFVNAWNEWCEGMVLEPTEENGYKYLEWIKNGAK